VLLFNVCLFFFVLSDINELLVANLKEQCTCIRFVSDLRKLCLDL
jgi:hypothetical protein